MTNSPSRVVHVLISGGTGFVARCLGVSALQSGWTVAFMTRKPRNQLVRALQETCVQLGTTLNAAADARVRRLPADPKRFPQRAQDSLDEVTSVFHTAGVSSSSALAGAQCQDVNVRGTLELFDYLSKRAPRKPRFYHFAPASISGPVTRDQSAHREELHLAPQLHDPYHVSKWAAELALWIRAGQASSLPLTLLRPTRIIGHSQSGYYDGRTDHLYARLDAVDLACQRGAYRLRMDLAANLCHDYIAVDDLVERVLDISQRPQRPREILHLCGQRFSNAEVSGWIADAYGVDIRLEPKRETEDRTLGLRLATMERFNRGDQRWDYDDSRVRELLGARRPRLDATAITRTIAAFRQNRDSRGDRESPVDTTPAPDRGI